MTCSSYLSYSLPFSPTDGKYHEGSLPYLQQPAQYLVHSRCSTDFDYMKEWKKAQFECLKPLT